MERDIQRALQDAGDHASAFLWRRLCRDLDGGQRVAVAARSTQAMRRLIDGLETSVTVDPIPLADAEPGASAALGVQDRVLGAHTLLFVTSYPTALGSAERELLGALDAAGAPAIRAVVLEGAGLLARLSDDPSAERIDVRARVASLLPPGWELLEAEDVPTWLAKADADLAAVTRDRRAEVARVLLRDAFQRANGEYDRAQAQLAEADDRLAEEHAVIDAARQRGRRIAAHLLSAVRAHTESLLIDLRDFLLRLEADAPAQVDAMSDLGAVRRALPHWLHHVVEAWMIDRLGKWRADVLTDLAEVHVAENEAPTPELLAPALHPTQVRGEHDWNARLAATAAVGGGAALLLLGQWIPGLLAVTGGIAWSALSRSARASQDRRLLVETAQAALRQMGQEADTVLRDQLVQIEGQLAHLADDKAHEAAGRRATAREELLALRGREADRVATAARASEELIGAIRELDPALAEELAS